MCAQLANNYDDKQPTYYEHARPEILPFIPKGIKSVLDVGCGAGNFGAIVKKDLNCEVWGIEPDEVSAREAALKIDKAIHGLFTTNMPELIGKTFDAIFFNDVLEHLSDPEQALNDCKRSLSPGGYVIASIPNIRWYPVILSLLRYKDFKYQNAGVMDKTHLRFFTLKSMRRLFEDTGFNIVTTQGINEDKGFKFFNILNALLLNSQWDMKFPQFVVVAQLP